MEDASQSTRTVRNFGPSDIIDATDMKKIGETSLILHLKMDSCWPQIGLVRAIPSEHSFLLHATLLFARARVQSLPSSATIFIRTRTRSRDGLNLLIAVTSP